MEITRELTKSVFESYVPVAKMPERDTSVYDRMQKAFERAYEMLVHDFIGQAFVEMIEANSDAKQNILALVAMTAFAQTARSLDLVLTSTGFGIVATNSTAPASQLRVENLLKEIRLNIYERQETLKESLTDIEGWNQSPQASRSISTLFWRISYMRDMTSLEYTADKWLWATGYTVETDMWLRRQMGGEQMDRLLQAERSRSLTDVERGIVGLSVRATAKMLDDKEAGIPPKKSLFDDLIRYLEDHAEELPLYKDSKIYQARHHEGYRNQKEDSSFFFM